MVGLEHAHKPGDLISVEGGVEGQVLQINWHSTQTATAHSSVAIVPNSIMAKSRLENRSAPTPMRDLTISVSVDAAVDPRRCLPVLDAAVRACRTPLPNPILTFECFGLKGDGIAYDIQFSVGSSAAIASARTEMLLRVHRHLRHAGIALGIPNMATPPPVALLTLAELLAEPDVFGALTRDKQDLLSAGIVRLRTVGQSWREAG